VIQEMPALLVTSEWPLQAEFRLLCNSTRGARSACWAKRGHAAAQVWTSTRWGRNEAHTLPLECRGAAGAAVRCKRGVVPLVQKDRSKSVSSACPVALSRMFSGFRSLRQTEAHALSEFCRGAFHVG